MQPQTFSGSAGWYDILLDRRHTIDRWKCSAFVVGIISLLLWPLTVSAVVTHKLAIEFAFDTSTVTGKEVSAYQLFASGDQVCEQQPPTDGNPLVCLIRLDDGTYSFTLAVAFDDGSKTPQSDPFLFTLSTSTTIHDINGDNRNDLSDTLQGLRLVTGKTDIVINSAADVNGDGRIGLEEVISSLREVAPESKANASEF